jgi:hypothetical protein
VTQAPALQLSQGPQATGAPAHNAFAHTSPVVHASPSSHGLALGVKLQPVAGAQVSSVHGLASSQTGAEPGRHLPLAGSQVSSPLQALPSLHAIGVPGTHPTAGEQLSTPLQGLPSSHESGVPAVQAPVAGLQVSTPLQALPSLHTIGVPGRQTPPAHVSAPLHGLASSHCPLVVHAGAQAFGWNTSGGAWPRNVAAAQRPGP